MSLSDPQAHLLTAVQAALRAGRAILDVYETENFDVEMKSDDSPLTRADRQAHGVIQAALEPTTAPILSEEGKAIDSSERAAWPELWIVDPLDGTKEFIKRNGEFTVNIALVQDHLPVLGVIYVPVTQTCYWACAGLGAWRCQLPPDAAIADLDSLRAQSVELPQPMGIPSPRALVIVGSRSHATPELEAFVADMRQHYGAVDFTAAGSSLKICRVAEGSADIYPRLGPTMEWDTAAGQAIAEMAGKSVTVWETGERLRYNREELLNPWFIVR